MNKTIKHKSTSGSDPDNSQKSYKIPNYLSWGVIILAVINIIFLILMFVLVSKFDSIAKAHNLQRNKAFDRTTVDDLTVYKYELETNKASIEKISNTFPNETGLLEFISNIESLKNEGTVSKISFTSKEPLKDKDGNLGIPILIEFKGTWGNILRDIGLIQQLPYIFKPVKFETKKVVVSNTNELNEIKPNEIQVAFGGFLYVDEEFSKN